MIKWWQISLLLCFYGFFKEYRPSEPFVSPFLTGEWKNFTIQQVTEEIYPMGTYFNLALLVMIFLLTDYLRYKPVLIIGGLASITAWSMIIVGKTIVVMQVLEFFYGLFMASEVAYYTYIYAKVDKIHYQKVTSYTRTALLLGKASAGLSSQLFVQFKLFDYLELNYLTVAALVVSTIMSFLLPSVPESMYFHRCYLEKELENESTFSMEDLKFKNIVSQTPEKSEISKREKFRKAFHYLYDDVKEAYTNPYVVKWSIWWALSTCGYLQIITYAQLLWQEIKEMGKANLANGLVEFLCSILGAAVAFGIGYVKIECKIWGDLFLGILTLIQGGCIFFTASLTNLYVAYALHISYGALYQTAITIASSEVATDIRKDSYALIFGINTFIALIFQTILTAVIVNSLSCPIRMQFQIYGYYLFITGGAYLVIAMHVLWKRVRIS